MWNYNFHLGTLRASVVGWCGGKSCEAQVTKLCSNIQIGICRNKLKYLIFVKGKKSFHCIKWQQTGTDRYSSFLNRWETSARCCSGRLGFCWCRTSWEAFCVPQQTSPVLPLQPAGLFSAAAPVREHQGETKDSVEVSTQTAAQVKCQMSFRPVRQHWLTIWQSHHTLFQIYFMIITAVMLIHRYL